MEFSDLTGTTGKIDSSGADLDEEEHVKGLQKPGLDGEPVAGKQLLLVMRHEVTPTPGGARLRERWNARAPEEVGKGLVTDV
jgi:hypothetical protein